MTAPASTPDPGPDPAPGPGPDLAAIVQLLLDLPEVASQAGRDEVVALLRRPIGGAVRRHPAARMDVVSLVQTCLRFPGGLQELLEAVRLCAGDVPEVRALARLVDRTPSGA